MAKQGKKPPPKDMRARAQRNTTGVRKAICDVCFKSYNPQNEAQVNQHAH